MDKPIISTDEWLDVYDCTTRHEAEIKKLTDSNMRQSAQIKLLTSAIKLLISNYGIQTEKIQGLLNQVALEGIEIDKELLK